MIKAAKPIPSISAMREPMAAPNTTKYNEVEITGDTTLCNRVRRMRASSKV